MGELSVPALDHTVQETNIWLKAIAKKLHFKERPHAYSALRAVRDRLTPDSAVHLGAQFLLLIRGIYYGGWHLAGTPRKDRSAQEFAHHVLEQLAPQFPMDPPTVTKGVFEVLWEKLDPGETAKIVGQLPVPLRTLWPQIARQA